MICPYIEIKSVQKAIIQYNQDMQETGNVVVTERVMMECKKEECAAYRDNKCAYGKVEE